MRRVVLRSVIGVRKHSSWLGQDALGQGGNA
jgi:hypothetical protein